MPRITKIYHMAPRPPQYPDEKVLVYIDGVKCMPVRARTWTAMGLDVGSEISCDELKELEKFHWKLQYQEVGAWTKEKVRIDKVRTLVEGIDPRLKVTVTGFGADSTDFIAAHPEISGKPDIEVEVNGEKAVWIEVSGTETMRGTTYWVRPDKLAYAQEHPDEDVWIILHFAQPVEKFVIIKPHPDRVYPVVEKVIRESTERYVEFDDKSPDVISVAEFTEHLKSRISSF